MGKSFVVTLILVSVVLPVLAEFTMPKSVNRMNELEKAQAEAQEKGRPITFILTQESTSCGLCINASLKAVNALNNKTVVVYVNADNEEKLLPEIVRTALNKPEAGRYIPKIVIVDSAMTNVLAIVPYAAGDEMDRRLNQAKKNFPKAMTKRNVTSNIRNLQTNTVFSIPMDESREMRVWQFLSGNKITASLIQQVDASIVLKKENGAKIKIAKYDLSKEDQDYIQDLKNKLSNKPITDDNQ